VSMFVEAGQMYSVRIAADGASVEFEGELIGVSIEDGQDGAISAVWKPTEVRTYHFGAEVTVKKVSK
jgi:hypothetical protein